MSDVYDANFRAPANMLALYFRRSSTSRICLLSSSLLARFTASASISALSSADGSTCTAFVAFMSASRISLSLLFFISISTTLSVLGASVDVFVVAAVDSVGSAVEATGATTSEGLEGEAKWIDNIDGPAWSSILSIVMGMAGLWYLRRGRQERQNFLRTSHQWKLGRR